MVFFYDYITTHSLRMSDPKVIVFEEPVFGKSFPLSGRKRKIKEPKEAKEPTLKKLKGRTLLDLVNPHGAPRCP